MAGDTETLGQEYLMPFERRGGASDAPSVEDKLFSLLESTPEKGDQPSGDESEADETGEGAGAAESEETEEESGEEAAAAVDDGEPGDDGEDDDQGEEDLDALYERLRKAGYKRKVKAHGEEIEVTLDDLDGGYSRTADYTRKTTETKQEKDAYRQAREKYDQGLAQLQQELERARPKKRTADEWTALKDSDPDGFALAWAEHQQFTEAEKSVQAERDRVAAQATAEAQKEWDDYCDEQARLLHRAVPEFADPEKGPVAKRTLSDYLRGPSNGFTDDELRRVADHRLYVLARKAQLWDEAQANGKGKIREKQAPKGASRTMTPGGRPTQGAQPARGTRKRVAELSDRLVKSGGSPDVAEEAMFAILSAQEKSSKRR